MLVFVGRKSGIELDGVDGAGAADGVEPSPLERFSTGRFLSMNTSEETEVDGRIIASWECGSRVGYGYSFVSYVAESSPKDASKRERVN